MIAIPILIGILLWWMIFGFENILNGARPGWLMPFRYLWQDMTGGECPYGLIHAAIMHGIIPVVPTALWLLVSR